MFWTEHADTFFESGQTVPGAVRFATLHLNHPQIVYPVRMYRAARSTRLVRVIADFSSTLVPVERLDGGIAVQYPWRVRCVFYTF